MYYSSKELQSLMKRQGLSTKDVLSEGEGGGLEKRTKLPNLRGCPLWTVPHEPDIVVILPKGRVTCKYANIKGEKVQKRAQRALIFKEHHVKF